MASKMMTCGHAANAKRWAEGTWVDCCGICSCVEVAETPDLTGRVAKCSYGGKPVPSSTDLAFFKHRPDQEFDEYYCGCFGWD